MATITLPDETRKQAVASLKRYIHEELEQEIGDLKAELFLDYFLKDIAPSVYNAAIADAQKVMRDRVADLDGLCSAPEFAYWGRAAVRRAR